MMAREGAGARKKGVPFGPFLALGGLLGAARRPRADRSLPRRFLPDARSRAALVRASRAVKLRSEARSIPGDHRHGCSPSEEEHARGPVGLDIDGRYLAAAQRRAADACSRLPAPTSTRASCRDGEVATPTALGGRPEGLLRRRTACRSACGSACPTSQIVVRQIELPWHRGRGAARRRHSLPGRRRDRHAARRGRARLPGRSASTEAPTAAARMQVVVVAARRSMIDGFVEAARGAGLKPEGIDLNAFALVRALAGPTRPSRRARCTATSAAVVNLAIAVGDVCVFTRPLSATWHRGRRADVALALADEIRLSIDYYMAQPDARGVGEVVLSGPGSRSEELVEELRRAMLRLPDHRSPPPLGALDSSGRAGRRRPPPLHRGRRPGPRSGGVRPVNLLPEPSTGPRAASGALSGSSYVVVGVLAVLVVLMVGALRRSLRTRSTSRENERGRGAAGDAGGRGQDRRARRLRGLRHRSPRRAAPRSSSWPRGRFDWERFMRELAHVLPGGRVADRGRCRRRSPDGRGAPAALRAASGRRQRAPRPSSPAAPSSQPTWPS